MKKSLGRRSSSRNPVRTVFTDFDNTSRIERKCGIPVRRAASIERNISTLTTPFNRNMVTPLTKRSASEDRNSMVFSAKCWTGGTERPSRSTTLSTNSARHSSYGGARSKRDNRPIEDKEWQMSVQNKVENYLMNDEEGCHLLVNGSIKPMALKFFISITDLLLKRLFRKDDKCFINKDNYITELPFYMKKLNYRGKIEKSWLISVNTTRSWCHVLACFDFLSTCVQSQDSINIMTLLFPEKYDTEDDDMWDYQIVLPYLQKCFKLFSNNDPNYEEQQALMDSELIEQHISSDNTFKRIECLERDIQKVRHEREGIAKQLELVKDSLQQYDEQYNNLQEEKYNCEEFIEKMHMGINESKNTIENMNRQIEGLKRDYDRKIQTKLEIEKIVTNQQISKTQLAELKQKRDSLQREIDRETLYVSNFEDMLQKITLEMLSQKKQIDNLIETYNLEAMKYFPFGLENAMLDVKKTEEENNQAIENVLNAINAAKHGLESLSVSNSQEYISKALEEIKSLEKQNNEKKNLLDKIIEKSNNAYSQKEEMIITLKGKLDSLCEKLNGISHDKFQNQKSLIKEKEKRAHQMEKQLSQIRSNAVYFTTEYIKLVEEYKEKRMVIEEESRKLSKDVFSK